jgi:hypothetical protein
MANVKLKCFSCGHEMEFKVGISRSDECPQCREDVRACKNCRFYDATAYNECREPQAEVVKEKDRANFCDFFEPSSGAGGNTSRDKLLNAAEALFKKKT